MRARTILLLAIPAVIAAVSVAVPALAVHSAPSGGAQASKSAGKAKKSTPKVRCVYTGKGKGRTRVCYVSGPAGAHGCRGPRGFVGAHGKRGLSGTTAPPARPDPEAWRARTPWSGDAEHATRHESESHARIRRREPRRRG